MCRLIVRFHVWFEVALNSVSIVSRILIASKFGRRHVPHNAAALPTTERQRCPVFRWQLAANCPQFAKTELSYGVLFGFVLSMFMLPCSLAFMLACTFALALAGLGDDVTIVFVLTLTLVFSVVAHVEAITTKAINAENPIILRISVSSCIP